MKAEARSEWRGPNTAQAGPSERRPSSRLHTIIAIPSIVLAGTFGLAMLAMGQMQDTEQHFRKTERLQTLGKHLPRLAMVCQMREHHRQGDHAWSHHDFSGARTEYDAAFEIARRLVEQEPENAAFRRHLAISYNRLGDLAQAGGEFALARELFTRSLELRRALAEADPQNKELQRDLSVSYSKLGKLAQHQGNLPLARELVGRSLMLSETLAKGEPRSVERQLDLATNHLDLAALIARATEPAAYRAHRNAAGEILERLDHGELVTGNGRFVMLQDRFVQMRE